MKVLLTGASGFIGSYVLDALIRLNIPVVELGRSHAGKGSSFIEADLQNVADFETLIAGCEATHLLHLAWCTEHGQFWTSPLNLNWVSVTTQLIEAFCAQGGAHAVVAGTCAEYDWSYGYCHEDLTPLAPATLYGVCKDATRRIVQTRCVQQQVTCAWARVFLPFGCGENSQRLIPALMDVFQGKRPAFGVNANAYRDFLHVSDVAAGLICLLSNQADGAFNIASAEPVMIGDLVKKLADIYHADPRAVLDLSTDRQGEPRLLIGDHCKLKALGWQPTISILRDMALMVHKA
jgi:nucleoside-diphosphate-sugar epimerase